MTRTNNDSRKTRGKLDDHPSKVEFLTRMEAAKDKLPNGLVPLYMTRNPKANRVRVSNTINGKIQDVKILENVEELAELITSKK